MKILLRVCAISWLLAGCSSDNHEQARPRIPGAPAAPPSASAAVADSGGASYEVSIASAEADRIRAQEVCDSGVKAERRECMAAADAAYRQAKTAADSARDKRP